ncbi:MAG TPA: hypothetical protein VHO47_00115 [Candidatus Babeliales bacterium]|nr:hypothetical protein [Candidatus Babeliales bacterium]
MKIVILALLLGSGVLQALEHKTPNRFDKIPPVKKSLLPNGAEANRDFSEGWLTGEKSISFYANIPVSDPEDNEQNQLSVMRGSINLNIVKNGSSIENKQKEKKDIRFLRACVRYIKLNSDPVAPTSKWNALELEGREIVDGGIMQYMETSKRIHKALGHNTKLGKVDFDLFSPKKIFLGHNSLESLPNGICQLAPYVCELSLECNRFKAIPKEVSTLINLQKLDVSGNPIAEIQPEDVAALKNLKELRYSSEKTFCSPLLNKIAKKQI